MWVSFHDWKEMLNKKVNLNSGGIFIEMPHGQVFYTALPSQLVGLRRKLLKNLVFNIYQEEILGKQTGKSPVKEFKKLVNGGAGKVREEMSSILMNCDIYGNEFLALVLLGILKMQKEEKEVEIWGK